MIEAANSTSLPARRWSIAISGGFPSWLGVGKWQAVNYRTSNQVTQMKRLLGLLAFLLPVGPAWGQDDRKPPAPLPPATTPIEAIQSLEAAVQAGDEAAIVSLTTERTDRRRRITRDHARAWARSKAFFDAIRERYGEDALDVFLGLCFRFPEKWIDLEGATTAIDGDTAVVTSKVAGKREKMIREGGRWKNVFDWDKRPLEEYERTFGPMGDAMRIMTPKIKAGFYPSPKAISKEFNQIADPVKKDVAARLR